MNISALPEEDEQPRRSTRVLDIKLIPADNKQQRTRQSELENEIERRPSVKAHPVPVLEMKQRLTPVSVTGPTEAPDKAKKDTPISVSQSGTTQNTTCNDVEFIQLKPAKQRVLAKRNPRESELGRVPVDKSVPTADKEKNLKQSAPLRPSAILAKPKYIEFKPVRETLSRKKSELLTKKDAKTCQGAPNCIDVPKQQSSVPDQDVPIKTRTPPRPAAGERSLERQKRSTSKSAKKEAVFRLVMSRNPAASGHPALFATHHSSYRKHFSPPSKRQLSP